MEFTRELLADISNWLPFGCLINISNLPCPKRISWFPPETYCCCSHHISVNGNSILLVVQGKILGLSLSLYLFLSHPVYNPSTNSFDFNIYPNLTTCHLYHQSPGSIHHCLGWDGVGCGRPSPKNEILAVIHFAFAHFQKKKKGLSELISKIFKSWQETKMKGKKWVSNTPFFLHISYILSHRKWLQCQNITQNNMSVSSLTCSK